MATSRKPRSRKFDLVALAPQRQPKRLHAEKLELGTYDASLFGVDILFDDDDEPKTAIVLVDLESPRGRLRKSYELRAEGHLRAFAWVCAHILEDKDMRKTQRALNAAPAERTKTSDRPITRVQFGTAAPCLLTINDFVVDGEERRGARITLGDDE